MTLQQTPRPRRRAAALVTFSGAVSNTLVVALQAAVLIPLYLRHIGSRLYGAWLGSGDFLVWLQAFDLGLPNLMIQRIGAAHGKGDRSAVGAWFLSGILGMAAVGLALATSGVLLAPLLPGMLGLSGEEASLLRDCFRAGVLGSCLGLVNNCVVALSRGIQKTASMNLTLVLAGLAGFGVSLTYLALGKGLWALPAGILARGAVMVAGSLVFLASVWRTESLGAARPDRAILRETLRSSPVVALGGIAYASMTYLDTALVAIFLGPVPATAFNLTRKAMDAARAILDAIGYATYGGFAHLVASGDRPRALSVLSEIRQLRWALGLTAAVVYIALNRSFISLWVGGHNYAGMTLTVLLAAQGFLAGDSYLLNYLYRAAGAVEEGSMLLIVECVSRLILTIVLLVGIGMAGIPAAAGLVAVVFSAIVARRIRRDLGVGIPGLSSSGRRGLLIGIAGCSLSAIFGSAVPIRSWPILATTAAAFGGLGLLLLVWPVRPGFRVSTRGEVPAVSPAPPGAGS